MTFRPSEYRNEISSKNVSYFMYEFDYTFRGVEDEVYCCLLAPYSYSRMLTHLYYLKQLSK